MLYDNHTSGNWLSWLIPLIDQIVQRFDQKSAIPNLSEPTVLVTIERKKVNLTLLKSLLIHSIWWTLINQLIFIMNLYAQAVRKIEETKIVKQTINKR